MIDQQSHRSQSIVELLMASVRLYRNHFLPFVLITALVLIPYNLLIFVLADSTTPLTMDELMRNLWRGTTRPNGGGWPRLIYNLIVQPIMHGTLILTAAQYYHQQPVSIESNVQAVRGRLGSLLGVTIQKALLLLVAIVPGPAIALLLPMLLVNVIPADWFFLATFFFPGVFIAVGFSLLLALYVSARLIVATQAVLFEDLYAADGIARSRALTKANAWRVTAFVGMVLLIQYGLPALFIGVAMSGVERLDLDTQLVAALQMVLVTIVQIVALPFSFIAHTLLFFDLRIRNPEHDPLTPGLRDGEHLAWLNT